MAGCSISSKVCLCTDPGLDHVGLPVELQEGGVLVQLGLPLGGGPLQLGHFPSQSRHLGADVVHVMVVLLETDAHVNSLLLLKTHNRKWMIRYLLDQLLSVGTHVVDSVPVDGEVRLEGFVLLQQALVNTNTHQV